MPTPADLLEPGELMSYGGLVDAGTTLGHPRALVESWDEGEVARPTVSLSGLAVRWRPVAGASGADDDEAVH